MPIRLFKKQLRNEFLFTFRVNVCFPFPYEFIYFFLLDNENIVTTVLHFCFDLLEALVKFCVPSYNASQILLLPLSIRLLSSYNIQSTVLTVEHIRRKKLFLCYLEHVRGEKWLKLPSNRIQHNAEGSGK